MLRIKKGIGIAAVAMTLWGCTSTLDKKSYVRYLSDPGNGLVKTQVIQNLMFSLKYIPQDYLTLLGNAAAEPGRNYFQLEISHNDRDLLSSVTPDQYYQLLNYFERDLNNDIFLINKSDTLRCILSHLQRDYGVGNKTTVLLEFERSETAEDKNVVMHFPFANDYQSIEFKFSKAHLNKIPKLK